MISVMLRAAPPVTSNGLPGWKPYVYRGTGEDVLTAFMDEPESWFDDLPSAGRALAPCGTEAAYARHRRRGEPIDAECRAANTRKCLDRRARQREQEAAA